MRRRRAVHRGGQKDEGHIWTAFTREFEGAGSIEGRQRIIRQDQIEPARLQGRNIIFPIPDLRQPADNPLPAEGFTDQLRIVRVVLQMENRKKVTAPRRLASCGFRACLPRDASISLSARARRRTSHGCLGDGRSIESVQAIQMLRSALSFSLQSGQMP